MAHDLQQLIDLLARNSGKPDASVWRKANARHHLAAEDSRHRDYPLVAALVNGIVSVHLCGPASILGGVRDEQVQRQLFHFHPVGTQAQKGSP